MNKVLNWRHEKSKEEPAPETMTLGTFFREEIVDTYVNTKAVSKEKPIVLNEKTAETVIQIIKSP